MNIDISKLTSAQLDEMPDFKKRDLQAMREMQDAFNPFYPLNIFACMEEDTPQYFFAAFDQFPHIEVKPPTKYVPYYTFFDATNYKTDEGYNADKPNNVGKLTKNKIDAWLEYYRQRGEYLTEVVRLKDEKIAAFIKEFEAVGGKLTTEKYRHGSQFGELVKNGIEYTVNIHQPSGHISQRITIHYKVGNNISNFLALAENQFTLHT